MIEHKSEIRSLNQLESYSAVIPTFNGRSRGYIDEAIQSVLLQSHPVKELIVVDDGSTDDTVSYLKSHFPSIVIVESENAGPSRARNLGLRYCTGKYVAFLDDDDVWLPNKIEKQLEFLSQPPNVACNMVVCGFNRVDIASSFIALELPPQTFLRSPHMFFMNAVGTSSTVVIKLELLRKIGGFDETLRFAEDYECWLRVAAVSSICSLNLPLANIRRHKDRASLNVLTMFSSVLSILDRQPAVDSNPFREVLFTYISFDYFLGALFKRRVKDAFKILGHAEQILRVDIFFCLCLMWSFRRVPKFKNFFRLFSVRLALRDAYR